VDAGAGNLSLSKIASGGSMLATIPVPVWIIALVGLMAAWAALDRLLILSVHWSLHRRAKRIIN